MDLGGDKKKTEFSMDGRVTRKEGKKGGERRGQPEGCEELPGRGGCFPSARSLRGGPAHSTQGHALRRDPHQPESMIPREANSSLPSKVPAPTAVLLSAGPSALYWTPPSLEDPLHGLSPPAGVSPDSPPKPTHPRSERKQSVSAMTVTHSFTHSPIYPSSPSATQHPQGTSSRSGAGTVPVLRQQCLRRSFHWRNEHVSQQKPL